MPKRRVQYRLSLQKYEDYVSVRLGELVDAGKSETEIVEWLARKAERSNLPHAFQLKLDKIFVGRQAAFDFKGAMLKALGQLARECGSRVECKVDVSNGNMDWSVVIRGMKHTMNGEPMHAEHTRNVSLKKDSGVGKTGSWGFCIEDAEVSHPKLFRAHFSSYWIVDDKPLEVWKSWNENNWEVPGRPFMSHTINDGTSYQGEPTRLLDDLLRLVRKLPRMMTYERACP